jgi:quinol monooxygenase YgiN
MPIQLHLRIRVESSRRADFLAFLKRAIPVYERPGGIRIELVQDMNAPDRLIEVVHYADRATFDADQVRVETDPENIALLAEWRTLLAEPPIVEFYEVAEL